MRPSTITLQQYENDLVANLCEVADFYSEGTLNDVFVEGFDATIRHNLRHYWEQHPQADLTNIAFQAKSFCLFKKVFGAFLTSTKVTKMRASCLT